MNPAPWILLPPTAPRLRGVNDSLEGAAMSGKAWDFVVVGGGGGAAEERVKAEDRIVTGAGGGVVDGDVGGSTSC